ncbi:MAG: aminotransferase class I/II-fold pyridoxal phosphate-dependent enzyme, partial [Candidatus Nanopelagicales bacterium]
MTRLADRLPDFPWDKLAPYAEVARAHSDGVVDLSVGTPVDPVPEVVQRALAEHANWPGYPTNWGTPALRDAIVRWASRTLGAEGLTHTNVLPTVGSKELVALLPTLLGLGADDTVVIPEIAYPTYDIGARIAGCRIVAADSTVALGPERVALVWLN